MFEHFTFFSLNNGRLIFLNEGTITTITYENLFEFAI